ncbi:hypothetical protein AB434_1413 [Heyndrickxia coagulans]|uniref:Uncharacterized protein n=1 Tax=Heyndrickxia coagulans TaxID=1398 RepID=A0AAN0WE08_HEYCO|nr:hypothetical protein SB48_HM08orf06249 [Heyndrickxia coagulans]AKN53818.1 hypothetical protein AB434_1413 [Heyndrickxia coagulans]
MAMKLEIPTNEVAVKKRERGPNRSISFPTTGCPMAVARYKAATSHAVSEGGT